MSWPQTRRSSPLCSLAVAAAPADGFLRLARLDGRWWFLTPNGEKFFSIAMNHIDSATLRYPDNIALWRDCFENSERRWIEQDVAPNLRAWGFNSVGWMREVVTRTLTIDNLRDRFQIEEVKATPAYPPALEPTCK